MRIGILAAAALAGLGIQEPPPDIHPLKAGTVWTYATLEGEARLKVAGTEKIGDVEAAVVENESGDPPVRKEFLVVDKEGLKALRTSDGERSTDFSPPVLRVKFPLAKDATWSWEGLIGREKASAKFTNKGEEEIEVPAGRFKAWRIDVEMKSGSSKHTGTNWYAPGTGIVRQDYSFSAGKKKQEARLELKKFEPPPSGK